MVGCSTVFAEFDLCSEELGTSVWSDKEMPMKTKKRRLLFGNSSGQTWKATDLMTLTSAIALAGSFDNDDDDD